MSDFPKFKGDYDGRPDWLGLCLLAAVVLACVLFYSLGYVDGRGYERGIAVKAKAKGI